MMRMNLSSAIKLFLFCGVTFLLFGCASTGLEKQNDAPLWLYSDTIPQIFPNEEFLARTAFADDAESARLRADSELSSFFSAEIQSCAYADETFLNSQDSFGSKTNKIRNLSRQIEVSSHGELVALCHTDVFFDKGRKQFAVCAYINREEAWNLLEPRLRSKSQGLEKAYQKSHGEKERFTKIILLNSVLKESDEFYSLYFLACGIVPKKAESFSKIDTLIQNAESESLRLKTLTKILIQADGDDKERLKTKLSEIFSKEGFSVGDDGAVYSVNVKTAFAISENGGIFISYPQISLLVRNADGIVLSSWAKQISKISAYTREACERMVWGRIEKELESNFIEECLNGK